MLHELFLKSPDVLEGAAQNILNFASIENTDPSYELLLEMDQASYSQLVSRRTETSPLGASLLGIRASLTRTRQAPLASEEFI